jgi:hypothetical protein
MQMLQCNATSAELTEGFKTLVDDLILSRVCMKNYQPINRQGNRNVEQGLPFPSLKNSSVLHLSKAQVNRIQ